MISIMLLAAFILGLLAFFEPCTIATHTLFAARVNRESRIYRGYALSALLLTRMLLLGSMTVLASAAEIGTFSRQVHVLMLVMVGLVYLVTRKVYLPIPHLEFFRLLPSSDKLPHAIKLGLTLPACTLPLVAIIVLISAIVQETKWALFAAMTFALMFTIPTIVQSLQKPSASQRILLSRAAETSPYLTTCILWVSAFLLWKTGL